MWGRCQHGFLTRTEKLALLSLTSTRNIIVDLLLQQLGIYMPQPINERFEPKRPPAPKQPPNKGK